MRGAKLAKDVGSGENEEVSLDGVCDTKADQKVCHAI